MKLLKRILSFFQIPFAQPGDVMHYYRRARRKEFDLPVANAAIMANVDAQGVARGVTVAVSKSCEKHGF